MFFADRSLLSQWFFECSSISDLTLNFDSHLKQENNLGIFGILAICCFSVFVLFFLKIFLALLFLNNSSFDSSLSSLIPCKNRAGGFDSRLWDTGIFIVTGVSSLNGSVLNGWNVSTCASEIGNEIKFSENSTVKMKTLFRQKFHIYFIIYLLVLSRFRLL